MEQKELSYFEKLYNIDFNGMTKQKNGLTYVNWAACWSRAKLAHPDAQYMIYENADSRPWFDDGKTAWVKTGVIINGLEHIEYLPIMDFKNKSIPSESVTSMDANKAIQRSITKACARHGVALHIYIGLDDTEENIQLEKLRSECMELIKKKASISSEAKDTVAKICKDSDENANGDPRLIESSETLEMLKKKLLAVRK